MNFTILDLIVKRSPYRLHVSIKLISLFAVTILSVLTTTGQNITPYFGPFPAPPANEKMLFYLQRTIDRNTLVYEINFDKNGQVNKHKPVKIHWIDYEDGGKTSPLTLSQKKLAYGIEFIELKGAPATFEIKLVSYKKLSMYLMPSGENAAYRVHVQIAGKLAVLKNIMVNIVGGTYLKPIVSSISITGTEIQAGSEITETINVR